MGVSVYGRPKLKDRHRLKAPIADYVAMEGVTPSAWLATGPDGYVDRASESKTKLPHVASAFCDKALADIANNTGYVMVAKRKKSPDGDTVASRLIQAALVRTLDGVAPPPELSGALALQLYIHPKGSTGTVYRCEYAVSSNRKGFTSVIYKYYDRVEKMADDDPRKSDPHRSGQNDELVVTKTFQKSSARAINDQLSELSLRIIRFVETVRKVRIHRAYCDFILDSTAEPHFIQAINVFTTRRAPRPRPPPPTAPVADADGRLVDGRGRSEPSELAPVPEDLAMVRVARAKHVGSDANCAGDYCDYELVAVEPELRIRPRDSPPPGETPPLPEYFHMANKSVILARFDLLLHRPEDTAAAAADASGIRAVELYNATLAATSPSASDAPSVLAGKFQRISPEDYYREVEVCASCYQIYTALDGQRSADLRARDKAERRRRRLRHKQHERERAERNARGDGKASSGGPRAWGAPLPPGASPSSLPPRKARTPERRVKRAPLYTPQSKGKDARPRGALAIPKDTPNFLKINRSSSQSPYALPKQRRGSSRKRGVSRRRPQQQDSPSRPAPPRKAPQAYVREGAPTRRAGGASPAPTHASASRAAPEASPSRPERKTAPRDPIADEADALLSQYSGHGQESSARVVSGSPASASSSDDGRSTDRSNASSTSASGYAYSSER
ncbi:uncharacterized protein AMSG_07783 [Thecamonas trahens ATCC 50062]|uniref:HORMA domain-containing protein n=1 Tax=Thecamonas trahens ATCC 50062 TaxID=461836 RepID=A0A0L0DH84_THETB|nr:hypothetical protein AMSG_07783 [Thecamonas trahens ATCC 50062]KNC51714.1 hypothetical protein AMSG_07783 [Thecamonas trahens ATCC 50062]|eukprot:XP_013755843.1 hypothetical protein AMSG_07783 [Thecamonas trahens ATCC 50062]